MRISTTDGDDQIIQTTGTIRLIHPGDPLTARRSPGTVERNPKEVDMSWIRRRIRRLRNLASGADYSGAHQGGSGTTSEQHNRASFEAQSYRPDRTDGGDWGGSV